MKALICIFFILFGADVAAADVHYFPKSEKPTVYGDIRLTQVCENGRKDYLNEKMVCLECPEGYAYIESMCYLCPEGSRMTHLQRKAIPAKERVRCILKEKFADDKNEEGWKEMPPIPKITRTMKNPSAKMKTKTKK